ncbi:MAG TPA: hypothetical protein VFK84_17870 [Burkholderiales bacterium]|nr:hypothetical protein [Burkholderiales bacterium]
MKFLRSLAVLAALMLAACGGTAPVSSDDETLSLVFGYFDMKDAPTKVQWVGLKQYGGKDAGTYSLAVNDGLFFHVGIEPGSYQVDKFGGSGFLRGDYVYNFGGKGRNTTAIRIQKAGVYFLGAHRYVKHPGEGFFSPDKFDMQPMKAPTEKELLQRVIKQMESDRDLAPYKRQLRLARERLAQL